MHLLKLGLFRSFFAGFGVTSLLLTSGALPIFG